MKNSKSASQRVRAGRPALQPVFHPNDEDLSLGTPVWRPALQRHAALPGDEVYLAAVLGFRMTNSAGYF